MLKRTILLTVCFLAAVFWISEANALSMTNVFTQSVNSYDDLIPAYTATGTNLFPNGSINTAFELSVYGNTTNDNYRSYIANNSTLYGGPYNTQGAEIWLSSFSRTWVRDFSGNNDPRSAGDSTATLKYHISGASNVKLSFNYYLSVRTALGDWHEDQSNYLAQAGLSLFVNNSQLLSETLQGTDNSLGSSYNSWITLPGGSGDLSFDARTYSMAVGNNGYASAGLVITNLKVSSVPLPPSVYLFGSGLVGLIGLRRFRRS